MVDSMENKEKNANFWGFRVDDKYAKFFYSQIKEGNLRQGWGWLVGQDLNKYGTKSFIDKGAGRNYRIYSEVKKGDYLLIPKIPTYDKVTIVQAKTDFCEGYKYLQLGENEVEVQLLPNYAKGDYRHVFPVAYVTEFTRTNKYVGADVRSSLKNPQRFWSMNAHSESIKLILGKNPSDLLGASSCEDNFLLCLDDAFKKSFDKNKFIESFYVNTIASFNASEWEYALVQGLSYIFPKPMSVERWAGKSEVDHGCDIVITIPGLLKKRYAIAIQVKDYEGTVSENPIDQINKADEYFKELEKNQDLVLIDKYILITKSKRSDNKEFILSVEASNKAGNKGITVIFGEELKELLYQMWEATQGLLEI